jgi:hypothetical protein
MNGLVQLKDALGNLVFAQGGWNSPVSIGQLFSSISAIHEAHGMGKSEYTEKCKNCYLLFQKNVSTLGCDRHHCSRKIYRTGNPTHSANLQNDKKYCESLLVDHKTRGGAALSPLDLLQIREYLMAQGTLKGFMLWTMICCNIRIFLRGGDELCHINMDANKPDCPASYLPTISQINADGKCEGIGLKVKGKTETKTPSCNLVLWADKECPDFCPVIPILTWIKVSGITSGYLFPPNSWFENPDSDSKTHIEYNDFLSDFKKICSILERAKKGVYFGTHSLKKTAYLIGKLGGATIDEMMSVARHVVYETAMKYMMDAAYVLAAMKVDHGYIFDKIPKWVRVIKNLFR